MFAPPEPEPDAEESRRVRLALVTAAANKVTALRQIRCGGLGNGGSYERSFLRRDPTSYDAADFALLERLTWHYRRALPRHLRPAAPPDDPIVRETERP